MRKEYIEDLESEIWVKNNGYEISNKGRIIGKKGKLLNCRENHCGYLQCSVKFEDGFFARSVHRAVAYTFLGKPPNEDDEVNHKDGNKKNNCPENLEWCTHNYNMKHRTEVLGCMIGTDNPTNKLTEEQVIEIYNLCKEGELLYKEIAEIYGVIPEEVNRIAFGVVWKHLGLEPLPKLVRGSRRRAGRKVLWINEDKEYKSINLCSDDLRNKHNIIVTNNYIRDICNNKLESWKGQQFKWVV
ncbi:HNH endonuclease signature motif containing protein [Clostridium beijerinckii]|uniref:HNH endonuclease signature motif containing protein n=1 Tax=Clostridium beijerinckii TaxID=1520 RepID=UPI00185AE68D|nr:HNH endonuclease signature motif containing protein [Clostridium beijerinckii]NRU52663.1 hypothetical protein [Clostridium beijerinckii]NYC68706.1 hypothetical protein [Clostridium beijerinckii]NYC91855.1 hypothetical protein [Clostridium beijerinckii]